MINFRNYANSKLELSDKVNVFVGPNGSGKTNLLDALYYISFTKSGISSTDQENIRHEESFFNVSAKLHAQSADHEIKCICQIGKKKQFLVDDSEYEKMSEHIGRFPCVLIQPADNDLIRGGASLRRKFFDILISQCSQEYLLSLIRYNTTLKQRNSLLRESNRGATLDQSLLGIYNDQLLSEGNLIFKIRSSFLERFQKYFKDEYSSITGPEEMVEIAYYSQFKETDFEEKFRSNLENDLRRESTLLGVHKDDFIFRIKDFPLKKEGSQGQQKSFIIALKLAMFRILEDERGTKPLLLMDDIFDKLDDNRMKHILSKMHDGAFGQVFITDARPERSFNLLQELDINSRIFEVEAGQVSHKKAR